MGNMVAIVGRPNVGKSTLFNRLVGQRRAIVDDFSGVTRDRHYGEVEWCGRKFNIVDTGGFVTNSADVFEAAIRDQVKIAIKEADLIYFMVDVTTGITDLDSHIADLLRRTKKQVYVVVNKVDNSQRVYEASVFYGMGFDTLFTLSSVSGSGTGELLDDTMEFLKPELISETEGADDDVDLAAEYDENNDLIEKEEPVNYLPKVAIVGRPNVGKSSLVNALLGEDRNIVTDIAGTTRDTIDTLYNAYGHKFYLVDTAGIRRKAKVKEDIEFYSVMRSINALENCDVAVLVIDATIGLDSQDMNLVHLAIRNSKGLMIVVNKWDLVEKDHKTAKEYEDMIREKLRPFNDVPILFTSATEKQRIHKLVDLAMMVCENRKRRIPTHKLNDVMLELIEAYPPPSLKGKYVKIKFVMQLPGRSPKFAFFCNLPQYVGESYKRYLENKIRENFDFHGVPMVIYMRKK
jgi:GTP-binding protein